MTRWRVPGPAALLALVLALSTLPAGAEGTRLTRDEARGFAAALLRDGQPAAAREVALALWKSDRSDIEALLLLSQASLQSGQPGTALDAATAAWKLSRSGQQKFASAIAAAQSLAAEERYTRAQVWLRRAANHAPPGPLAEVVARDYAMMRQANPMSVSLGFNVTPSSNVNNGSRHATTTFEGSDLVWSLLPEGRALSGVEISAEAELKYRLGAGERGATHLEVSAYVREVVLSASAKDLLAEDPLGPAGAGDFAYAQATLGLTHNHVAANGRDPWWIGVSVTRSAYGGDPLSTTGSLRMGRQWALPGGDQAMLGLTLDRTFYDASGERATSGELTGRWGHALANGDRLTFGLTLSATESTRATRENTGAGISLGWDLGEIRPGVDLNLTYALEYTRYPVAAAIRDARIDLRHTLRADVGLQDMAVYGFEPVLSVEAGRNISNVDLFDGGGLRLGLGLRSQF